MSININCRLCCTPTINGIEIFGPEGVELSIVNILQQHYSIRLNDKDSLGKIVCKKCWRTTEKFHRLHNIVIKNEIEYHAMLRETIKDEDEAPPDSSNVEIKTEVDNTEPTYIISTVTSTNPPILQTIDEDVKIFAEVIEYNDNISDNDDFNLNTPDNIKVELNDRKTKRNTRGRAAKRPTKEKTVVSTYIQRTQNEDRTIDKELGLCCEICSVRTLTFLELKRHYLNQHELNGYLKCCNTKFFRRGLLYNHIVNHGNPNRYKCKHCNKVLMDNERLRKHVRRHDPAIKKHECNKCFKKFTSPSMLKYHIMTVHKTKDTPKSYICDICHKGFITKNSVSHHIISIHVRKYACMCEICAKPYASRKLLDYHYKSYHMKMDLPKFQCTICGSWLAHLTTLKTHMKLHNPTKETCNMCGKITPNKFALKDHIRSVHSTKLFVCNFCDKTFKLSKSLKDHISSHTGSNLHKCKYCFMEFNSGANMYKHRKRMHPIEWQQDRDKQLNGKKIT